MASAADKSETFGMGVTLIVGGAVITGFVVPEKEYLREFGKILATFPENLDIPSGDTPNEVSDTSNLPTHYIHIKNPQILSPNAQEFTFGEISHPHMRFMLSTVDGFMLGSSSTP